MSKSLCPNCQSVAIHLVEQGFVTPEGGTIGESTLDIFHRSAGHQRGRFYAPVEHIDLEGKAHWILIDPVATKKAFEIMMPEPQWLKEEIRVPKAPTHMYRKYGDLSEFHSPRASLVGLSAEPRKLSMRERIVAILNKQII